jgi:hypothetical protein
MIMHDYTGWMQDYNDPEHHWCQKHMEDSLLMGSWVESWLLSHTLQTCLKPTGVWRSSTAGPSGTVDHALAGLSKIITTPRHSQCRRHRIIDNKNLSFKIRGIHNFKTRNDTWRHRRLMDSAICILEQRRYNTNTKEKTSV